MKDTTFFYRHGIYCLIAKDNRSDEWMCFVGFNSNHKLFNAVFYRTNAAPLYKYSSINSITTNKVWSNLNWLGCSMHPYSKNKTIELLKQIADEIACVKKKQKLAEQDEDEMSATILDMVTLS